MPGNKKGGDMRTRQKLILILFALAVFYISFVYVPYAQYYSNGVKTHAGHFFRPTFLYITELPGSNLDIDAELIIAEVIALTAITTAVFLILKR